MSAAPYSNGSTGQMVFYPNPPQGNVATYDPYQVRARQTHMNTTADHMSRMSFHETPQGRMALPMQGGPQVVMMNQNRYTPSPAMTDEGMFEPMNQGAPQLQLDTNSPSRHYMQSRRHHEIESPTDLYQQQLQHQLYWHQQQQLAQAQANRPSLVQRHSIATSQPGHRPAMQRQLSLQVPAARSASPQIVGDVFDARSNGSPIRRSNSALGIEIVPDPMPDPMQDMVSPLYLSSLFMLMIQYFGGQTQGITPSRALGPAPQNPFTFTHGQPAITPSDKRGIQADPVSASTTLTAASSSSDLTDDSDAQDSRRSYRASSDDDNDDSPTKATTAARARKGESSTAAALPLASSRPSTSKSAAKTSNVIGGRTSAKFAQVAVDPGVEGIPDDFVISMDRPTPSFACIIGQAILSSSAGGLSLEHIYRYVETLYPFFQKGDGAWRNSVRHNLSIHKMFETIPRTEHYPPGKGGIWIIHDDEKLHWPSRDKFVKNFQPTHPHHPVCRQTLHELEKERQAKLKAESEGKIYVPKKAKKVKKGAAVKEEDGEDAEMVRSLSSTEMVRSLSTQSDGLFAPSSSGEQPRTITPQQMHIPLPSSDIDEYTTFSQMPPPQRPSVLAGPSNYASTSYNGTMAPPRFGVPEKRRYEDDGDLFGSNIKKLRVPLNPIDLDTQQYLNDNFITPERDRSGLHSSTNKMAQSSTLKTPALVNTSSSPGSSPMPPTVPRTTHHPSALHQGWTHHDIESSPAPAPLGAAFDFEVKAKAPLRKPVVEDDFVPMGPPPSGLAPKTPVTRSSAHQKPRTPHEAFNTPYYAVGSPMSYGIPPLSTDNLSTPAWEMRGCIDRLKDNGGTESPDGSRDILRYSLAACGSLADASPKKRQAA
jgi:hypothetical protein